MVQQSSTSTSIRKATLLALVTCVVAYLALGYSASERLSPENTPRQFLGIAKDGWIVNESSVALPALLPGVSILKLSFDHWRPASAPPAHLSLEFCDGSVHEFLLLQEAEQQAIRLTNKCFMRDSVLRFRVHNPVRAGPSDTRMLGAKLRYMQLTSSLGTAVLFSGTLLCASLLSAVLLLLSYFLVPRRFALPVLALEGVALVFVLSRCSEHNRFELLLVIGLSILVLLGLAGSRCGIFEQVRKQGYQHSRILLYVLLASTTVLRFYGLDFGLPAFYHPDEVKKAEVIESMRERQSLNPEYFLHPSLLLYSTYATRVVLETTGVYQKLGAFRDQNKANISTATSVPAHSVEKTIFAGRIVSALAGSLSVLVVFCIGSQMHSQVLGLLAAAIFGFSPLAVTCSRYMKEDALLLFFLLLAFFATLRALQSKQMLWYVATGAAIGCAAGTKYSGVLAGIFLLPIPFVGAKRLQEVFSTALRLIPAGVLVVLCFLLTTPYALIDASSFSAGLAHEQSHMLSGHDAVIDPWSQYWMYHFRRSLSFGMHEMLLLVASLGIGVALHRRSFSWLAVFAVVLCFYLPAEWVRAKPPPQAERYVLPCVPFIALLAAWTMLSLKTAIIRRVLIALCLLLPLSRSLLLASELRTDTRQEMTRWIEAHIPQGSSIAIEQVFYAPNISPRQYHVRHLHVASKPWQLEPRRLARQGVQYVVLSSLSYERFFTQPNAPLRVRRQYEKAFDRMELVKEIAPAYRTYAFHNPRLLFYSLSEATSSE